MGRSDVGPQENRCYAKPTHVAGSRVKWGALHMECEIATNGRKNSFPTHRPNSDNQYRFRVREYLDLRHNSEVAYSEWSTAARMN